MSHPDLANPFNLRSLARYGVLLSPEEITDCVRGKEGFAFPVKKEIQPCNHIDRR